LISKIYKMASSIHSTIICCILIQEILIEINAYF
jgi:hypothetical protein